MDIYEFDELDSTNDYLKKNYKDYKDSSVVLAYKQTKGRGRFDRVWVSKNDLTFSILFKKDLPNHFIAPLSIYDSINHYKECNIKWPNDILINGIKVSGILIEKIINDNITIVGIGINIEKREDYAFLDIDKKDLLNKIINMYKYYSNIDISDLKRLYIEKSSIINKEVIFEDVRYKVIDITNDLELVVNNGNDTKTINANEINYNTMKISK